MSKKPKPTKTQQQGGFRSAPRRAAPLRAAAAVTNMETCIECLEELDKTVLLEFLPRIEKAKGALGNIGKARSSSLAVAALTDKQASILAWADHMERLHHDPLRFLVDAVRAEMSLRRELARRGLENPHSLSPAVLHLLKAQLFVPSEPARDNDGRPVNDGWPTGDFLLSAPMVMAAFRYFAARHFRGTKDALEPLAAVFTPKVSHPHSGRPKGIEVRDARRLAAYWLKEIRSLIVAANTLTPKSALDASSIEGFLEKVCRTIREDRKPRPSQKELDFYLRYVHLFTSWPPRLIAEAITARRAHGLDEAVALLFFATQNGRDSLEGLDPVEARRLFQNIDRSIRR